MKRLLTTVAFSLAVSTAAFPQTTLPGFLGIPWGSSREDSQKIIADTKPEIRSTVPLKNSLVCVGTFAGHIGSVIYLSYLDNRLYMAQVDIDPAQGLTAIEEYNGVKTSLVEKYSKPAEDVVPTNPPNQENVDVENGIRDGKVRYLAKWLFSDNNGISLTISNKLKVLLIYYNLQMTMQAVEKEKNDY